MNLSAVYVWLYCTFACRNARPVDCPLNPRNAHRQSQNFKLCSSDSQILKLNTILAPKPQPCSCETRSPYAPDLKPLCFQTHKDKPRLREALCCCVSRRSTSQENGCIHLSLLGIVGSLEIYIMGIIEGLYSCLPSLSIYYPCMISPPQYVRVGSKFIIIDYQLRAPNLYFCCLTGS